MNITNTKVSWHRNGISGWPFYVVLFDMQHNGVLHRMVATLPCTTEPEDSELPRSRDVVNVHREHCVVSVLCVDKLAAGDITFGSNSWRGDDFADALWDAIDLHEKAEWEKIVGSPWRNIAAYAAQEQDCCD